METDSGMGYKRLITMDVTEILRRKRDGQSISEISEALGYDRKTIRKYLITFGMLGNSDNLPSDNLPDAASIQPSINVSPGRPKDKQELLLLYKQEIEDLVTDKHNPLKPKSAFEVICQRHDLTAQLSYSSFKRFVRKHHLGKRHKEITCRFEHEAASQRYRLIMPNAA
ncbi:MAG: hypothetical protein Q8858_07780 [Bacteroidota bacterium]|nr:hypothetical protein [Bacteroidota bacterium]